jgi:hypothetical protein
VPPGNLYYFAGSFGNPEIVKVVSDQEVFNCPDLCSTQIATSLSGSPKLSKSWKSDTISFSILHTNCLPFPKKEEVVLHPERACAPGRTLHVISEREEHRPRIRIM